jgi:hypothetical protein
VRSLTQGPKFVISYSNTFVRKAKPKSKRPKESDVELNLIMAIGVTAVISILCSIATAFLVQRTLDAFQDSHAMVGLITDQGLKFDDKNTENQLSSATLALMATRDIALAVGFGSLMVIGGLVWRATKSR